MSSQLEAKKLPEWRPKLLFHRLMFPMWLQQSKAVEWNFGALDTQESNETRVVIKQDTSDWENIFRILLIPEKALEDETDITVKMKVGVELPEPPPPPPPYRPPPPPPRPDPMSYMISDGDNSIGMQLMDISRDYSTTGPYQAVEGKSYPNKLHRAQIIAEANSPSTATNNPDQFELSLKPSEMMGTAYCALDGGHKIIAQYNNSLQLSKGLWFEMYRFEASERYQINYIEITVYEDSKPPKN